MLTKNRRLTLENLEVRQMMAGDVAAYVQNGTLYINEAPGQIGLDNAVQISRLANGMIRVAGTTTTTDNTMTHVNGLGYQDFSVWGGLNVSLGGGSDLLVIGSELGVAAPSFQFVHIDTAAPPPVFQASLTRGLDTALKVSDNDNVIIWGISSRGGMSINSGAGNDWIFVSGAEIAAGGLTVNSGSGADTVEIKGTVNQLVGTIDIQTYSSLAENDADVVWLDTAYFQGDLNVRTGGGNDLFHMENSSTLSNLNLDMGAGDDSATLLNVVVVKKLMAQLGDGNDALSLDYLYGDDFHFLGGGGNDSLTKTPNVFGHALEQTGWEWINGRPQLVANVGTISTMRAV